MDYDNIVKGRRRNWEALKPDEIRELEKQAEKEKRKEEREKKLKKERSNYQALRDLRKQEEADLEKQRFKKALIHSAIIGGVFFGMVIFYYGSKAIIQYRTKQSYIEQISDFERVMISGDQIFDMSDPVSAFASWRSAWMNGDMEKVVSLFSDQYVKKQSRTGGRRKALERHKMLYERGALRERKELAENFLNAEILRSPISPWMDGELAIFRSDYLLRQGDTPPGNRYIVAFSYDSEVGQWRFADLRVAEMFSIRWEEESEILPVKLGKNAIRYDESGARILEDDAGWLE